MTQIKFSDESLKLVQELIARYPEGRQKSALIPVLHIAQAEFDGWLSAPVMDYVASLLKLQPIEVYEVASFYSMFNLKPVGKHKLTVCTNLPCQLQGATACAAHAKQKLGIEFGETTADGLFTLKEGECFGACGDAPVFTVNNHDVHVKVTAERFDALVDELKKA